MSAFVRDRDRRSGNKGVIGLPRHPLPSQTEYSWIVKMRFTKRKKPTKITLNNISNLMILVFFACTELNQGKCVQHIWVVVLSLGAVKGEMGLPGGQDRVGNVYSQPSEPSLIDDSIHLIFNFNFGKRLPKVNVTIYAHWRIPYFKLMLHYSTFTKRTLLVFLKSKLLHVTEIKKNV